MVMYVKKINAKLTIIIILIIVCLGCLLIVLNSVFSSKEKYTTYIDINYEELMNKIDNSDSFILFIYQLGCTHCESFKPKLNEVIKKYNLKIYAIDLENLDDKQYEKIKNKTFISGTPTTVYFKNGKKEDKITGDKSKEKLINFLKKAEYIKED